MVARPLLGGALLEIDRPNSIYLVCCLVASLVVHDSSMIAIHDSNGRVDDDDIGDMIAWRISVAKRRLTTLLPAPPLN